jgi:hypothetical protein
MGLEYKLRSTLKLNYKLFLDMTFLREGGFSIVTSGQQFYDGSVMSRLVPDEFVHEQYAGMQQGQVWQSAFRQWVYESGVPVDGALITNSPTVASGVYVHGAFRQQNDPAFPHKIDFINGRVIFDSPLPLDTPVHADFTYRHVRVGFEHQFNQQFDDGFLESKFTTNPETSMQLVYPSGTKQPFPAVFIEVDGREQEAYELGNRSLQTIDEVKFHIWALDDLQRDNIVDILTSQERKAIPLINFNGAPLPLSGIFNQISPEYIPYQNLLRNNKIITTIGSGTPICFMSYIDKTEAHNEAAAQEYERALVTFNVRTIMNAPVTPLGHVFAPISRIPVIGDTDFN